MTGYFNQEGVRNQIASYMEMELLKSGFTPIERSRIQVLLDEQKFQASEMTTTTDAVKAGKILNVPVVMLIDIPEFGEQISISAKMLDVSDGSILWIANKTERTGDILTTALAATAGAVIGSQVDSDNRGTGAVIGGVLGGAAGYALSPKAAERAQKVIRDIGSTLPSGMKSY